MCNPRRAHGQWGERVLLQLERRDRGMVERISREEIAGGY